MIKKECFTAEWIEQVSSELHYNDKNLIEKVIRALSLLEMLVKAGCPLVFKGGTALMLILGKSAHRLSIDIDLICPPGTNIEDYLKSFADFGFINLELVERKQRDDADIPKSHSKFFYQIAYRNDTDAQSYILLDVLYEDIHYFRTQQIAMGAGLFITNEGNFQYGNATLSYYDPATKQVQNEIFFRANGMKLGDVAQSMTIYDNKGWVVVNNSHVIFAIDLNTFKEVGRIENLTSPRYIHFLSDEKAYVTQLWDNRIFIINPKKYEITGYIQVPDMTMESGSTEQMVQYGKYVYCNCWSYQNRIIKIDTETDQVVDELKVGIQPTSLVMDKYNKMWTVTDGGYEGSPYGYEAPSLYRIDAETFTVEKQFKFKLGDWPSEVQLNGDRDKLYWINKAIWSMDVTASHVPVRPFLEYSGTIYYGLTVNPANGEVYIADAIDYQQQGMIYRYSPEGKLIDEFYVGIIPGAFCWK